MAERDGQGKYYLQSMNLLCRKHYFFTTIIMRNQIGILWSVQTNQKKTSFRIKMNEMMFYYYI